MNDRSDLIPQISLDEAAERVDDAVACVPNGRFSAPDAISSIASTVAWFIHQSISTPQDSATLLEYASDAAREVAELPTVMDPVLIELFEDQVESLRLGPEIQARLENALEVYEIAASNGDIEAQQWLLDLCRTGFRTERLLLSVVGASSLVIETAIRLRHIGALRDAVSPEWTGHGQIAQQHDNPEAYREALDALAHFAAHPSQGHDARQALVDLVEHIDTAADAAVRLPLHLLDDSDRQRLIDAHEARSALFDADPVFVPVGLEMLRANRVVRAAVWQAYDARHLA